MSNLTQGVSNALDRLQLEASTLVSNPIATAVGGALVGGALVGGVAGIVAKSRSKSSKSSSKKRSVSRKSRSKKRGARKRSPKYARTAGKGKDRSTKRIRMTKNGQPYVILKSGKARFIKKSSARLSRKKKGGRY